MGVVWIVKQRLAMKTGEHIVIKNILGRDNVENLKKIADAKFKTEKELPFVISKQKHLGANIRERYENAGVLRAIAKCSDILKREIGKELLITGNKSLVRRTWPMGDHKSKSIKTNASNLTWHQDTNQKHQDKAMIVIMCNLDETFGIDRPGLQLINADTKEFKGYFGYEGHKTSTVEKEILREHGVLKIEAPLLGKGDGLIFNGLTFHRTYSNEDMEKTRDALLIRIVKPCDEDNFDSGDHLTIRFN